MSVLYKTCSKCNGDVPHIIVKGRSVGQTTSLVAAYMKEVGGTVCADMKNERQAFPIFAKNKDIRYDCICKDK